MRVTLIAGNWKMHKTRREASGFVADFLPLVEGAEQGQGLGDLANADLDGIAILDQGREVFGDPFCVLSRLIPLHGPELV